MLTAFKKFLRAVLFGGLASGSIFLVFTLPVGIEIALDGGLAFGAYVVLMPLLLSFAGTLAGALIAGLPFTLVLRWLKRESVELYVAAGIFFGIILPLIVASDWGEPALLLSLFGMLAGGICAGVWGTWRIGLRVDDEDLPVEE